MSEWGTGVGMLISGGELLVLWDEGEKGIYVEFVGIRGALIRELGCSGASLGIYPLFKI